MIYALQFLNDLFYKTTAILQSYRTHDVVQRILLLTNRHFSVCGFPIRN